MSGPGACPECLRRTWLLARLAGHLDRVRDRVASLLELADDELIAAVGGRHGDELRRERAAFDPDAARARAHVAGLEQICRCDARFPVTLGALAAPPAVLHVAGGLTRFLGLMVAQPVAIVGARRASPYGLGVARSLSRGLGASGLTVISGMALGIDTAAHEGALESGAATVAVLAAGADRPYPATAAGLHRRIQTLGAVVSELGPGVPVRRWMFPARNRLIAGLSAMTVVVQARPGSGALLTARCAAAAGRLVGAVPGQVTAPSASGPHELLRAGAHLVTGPQDVLDALFGDGARRVPRVRAPALAAPLPTLLEALADGLPTRLAFERAGLDADGGLAALASLELAGLVRRGAGGRFSVAP